MRPDTGERVARSFTSLAARADQPTSVVVEKEFQALRRHLRRLELHEAAAELARSGATRDELLLQVRAIIDTEKRLRTQDQLELLARIELLPDELRPDLGTRTMETFETMVLDSRAASSNTVAEALTSVQRQLRRNERNDEVAALVESGVTREQLNVEVRGIAQQDGSDRTRDHLHRLALLELLPDELRPDLGTRASSSFAKIDIDRPAVGSVVVRNEYQALRRHIRSIDLHEDVRALAESGGTREEFALELRELADRRATFSSDDLRRVALIEGLPDGQRPSMGTGSSTFTNFTLDRESPTAAALRKQLDRLAAHLDHEDLAHDAMSYVQRTGVSRNDVLDELHRIASKPPVDIDRDDMRWIGMLEHLPSEVRPALPALDKAISRFATTAALVVDDRSLRGDLDALRDWARFRSAAGTEELRALLAEGRPLPGWLGYAVADDAQLAATLELDELARLGVAAADLKATATHGRNPSVDQLRALKQHLTALAPNGPAEESLRTTALEALERDIARRTGATKDGYSTYVDFADVGSATTSAELLVRMRRIGSGPATDALTGPASLSW